MNLLKFYENNIDNKDYYYKFYNEIITEIYLTESDYDYNVFDIEEAKEKFKKLCYPSNHKSKEENIMFLGLCYYLRNNGFQLKQFPTLFDRPIELEIFSYNEIRKKILLSRTEDNNIVRWRERIFYIDNFIFLKRDTTFEIFKNLKEKIKLISTRNADFDIMSIDEKLEELSNLIENLLKKSNDKDFIDINYDFSCNILSKDLIKKYRKMLHCFRHASKKSIYERSQYSENQKNFLIDFGIMICNHIYENFKLDIEFK